MLGSIEELEKEIEQFQNNMKASGEIVTLLRQMVEQIKNQNESFDQKSEDLIYKVDSLPSWIENANTSNNTKIHADVSTEMEQAVRKFGDEQKRYLQELEQLQRLIQSAETKLEVTYKEFEVTMEKMNTATLFEQNQQLRSDLNKRTIILMAFSIIIVIIGIVGFFI